MTRTRSPVLRDLLAGRDARGSVAEALSTHAPVTATKEQSASMSSAAFAGYRSAVTRVSSALMRMRVNSDRAAPDALAKAIDAVRAYRLLLDARVDEIGARIDSAALPAVAKTRWSRRKAALDGALYQREQRLDALHARLLSANPHLDSVEIDDLQRELVAVTTPAHIFGANPLPVHRPHLPARAPRMTPLVDPSYAAGEADVAPVGADLSSTDEALQTDAILAKAQSLGHDYTRIFDFVRSQVRTQWYAGSQKGADGTLATLAGNDVDQASLLIALLRASGAPARYVSGVVEVPVEDLRLTLGVRADNVGIALGAAGIASEPVVSGGHVAAFRIEQIFVSARIPYSAYRGTSVDRFDATWIPLLPALKPHVFVPATNILGRIGVDIAEFVDGALSTAQTVLPRAELEARAAAALSSMSPSQTLDAQLAISAVQAPALELLPAGPPVPIRAVTGEFSTLPDQLHQVAHLVVRSGDTAATIVLETRIPVSVARDHRFTLSYEPASIDDGAIVDAFGGLGATPAYLVHLRPILSIDGVAQSRGTVAVEDGTDLRLDVEFLGPAGSVGYSQTVLAGGYDALVVDVQGEAPVAQAGDTILAGDSEPEAARLLANFGARYLAAWDAEDEPLARLMGVSPVRPFPAVALVLNQYRVDRVDGVVDSLAWQGVALDAGLRPVEPIAQTSNTQAERDWLLVSALQGSALEHRVFEEQWAVESASADKGLSLARDAGIQVLHLAAGSQASGLSQPPEVIASIQQLLDRGFAVDVPHDPVTIRYWHGAVWRASVAASGESGYLIAGGLAGGATAMPPELWYFQDLAELLANPYFEHPNSDPNAAVAISIDSSTQGQRGTVDTDLARPLRAVVRDVHGHPVLGATVIFNVMLGGAKLIDQNSTHVDQLTVTTDRFGVAQAPLHLGTRIITGYFRIDPSMTYPQYVGATTVDVFVQTDHSVLRPGQPFSAEAWPGAPATVSADIATGFGALQPGVSYESMAAKVKDANGNEISNAPVVISSSTTYAQAIPGCVDEVPDAVVNAALFTTGQCPADAYSLTGNPCTTPTLSVLSRPLGAPFNVVPPNAALATVDISLTSGAANDHLTLSTDDFYQVLACGSEQNVYAFLEWGDTPPVGEVPLLGQYLPPIDAARPFDLFPLSRRGSVVVGTIRRSNPPTMQWEGFDGATITFDLTNAQGTNLRSVGNGNYLWDLRAGATPGPVTGTVFANLGARNVQVPLSRTIRTESTPAAPNIHGWVVDLHPPVVTPAPIPLTPFNVTDATINVASSADPPEYGASPINLQVLDGDSVIIDSANVYGRSGAGIAIARGVTIDPTHHYSARTILNDGTPYRMVSEPADLLFGRGLIAGYGVVPVSVGQTLDPFQVAALISGSFPKQIETTFDFDVASQFVCPEGQSFAFMLAQDARVTLKFLRLDSGGHPSVTSAWTPIDDAPLTQGVHQIAVTPTDLPFGRYEYQLTAVAQDGHTDIQDGGANNLPLRHDSLPLAHSIVKGVDVFSGNAFIGEEDIVIAGRGPGLKLTRSYSSHQGNQLGFLGYGWSSDLDSRVLPAGCDTRVVTGSAGQGMRFAPDHVDADGTEVFRALAGFHATLTLRNGTYDLYTKDGTRHHFGQPDIDGMRLDVVADTNGNKVTYVYDIANGRAHVSHIKDDAGRQIDLDYAVTSITQNYGFAHPQDHALLLTRARGPEGLQIDYSYDEFGNLIDVTRGDGGSGNRHQTYAYQDFGGLELQTPAGIPYYTEFGFRLEHAMNALDGADRRYEYAMGWSAVEQSSGILYVPEQRVAKLTEPDEGMTQFDYIGVRGLSAVDSTVLDAREKLTTYNLNRYGAATRTLGPLSTTTTDWDVVHLQPHSIVDEDGTLTEFDYDASGNKVSETIHHASGAIARFWTYRPASEFSAPYIKDRVGTHTDGRQIVTTTDYDLHGNPKSTLRGGVIERDDHAANGDRISHTDGTGNLWLFRYDSAGNVAEVEDPLQQIRRSIYDARGRKTSETDPNGNTTTRTYDARDRVVSTQMPATSAGSAVHSTRYDDVQDQRIDTSPMGTQTVSHFDHMGRLTEVDRPGGLRRLHYDVNGNRVDESDFSGNVTRYEYDDANHVIAKHEEENRTTLYEVDPLGLVMRETVGRGPDASEDARVTEYLYEDPQYKRTDVRRKLHGSSADVWVVDHAQYDGNGNTTLKRDPLLRETKLEYDERDRLHMQTEPLGKVTIWEYDAADRKTFETRANDGASGDQVRAWNYDAAGRNTETVDAEGGHRSQVFDSNGNVLRRRDARGGSVVQTFDALNHPLSQTGPEGDQHTEYTYDIDGNRSAEVWANGRNVTYAYDALDRRTDSSDEEGLFERLTYLPDGDVETRTDANGHDTIHRYDHLRRLVREDLPLVDSVPRAHVLVYDVHGDIVADTDPGQHITRSTYDSIGRRTAVDKPVVDGVAATLSAGYDLVGNTTSQSDARGNITHFEYDELNRRMSQTDPADGGIPGYTQSWVYDVVGNEVGHTDRRGVVSLTRYDHENRVTAKMRDALLIETITRDAQGNVDTDTDALGRTVGFSYDRANRKTGESQPLGATLAWTYSPLGDVLTATDADGRRTTSTYTHRRFLESETNDAGETSSYTCDGEGHRTAMQRPLGEEETWQYAYDAADRLAIVTDPLGHATLFDYDVDGNRTSIKDANQHVTQFAYDERHQLRVRNYPATAEGSAVHHWAYDADGHPTLETTPNGYVLSTIYDAIGRRVHEDIGGAGAGEVAARDWTYDGNGNVVGIDETLHGGAHRLESRRYDAFDRVEHISDVLGRALDYIYDTVGNRTALKDSAGAATVWTYNALNHNLSVAVPGQGTTTLTSYPSGLAHTVTRPDGSVSETTYDLAGRIDTIEHTKAGATIARSKYRYDLNGNRLEQRELNGAATQSIEESTTYIYDEADRLVHVDAPDRATTYTLDAVANRTAESVTAFGTPVSQSTLVYDARDRLTSRDDPVANVHVMLAYDADGNQTEETAGGVTRTFHYDPRDRLTSLSQPNAPPLTFDYDPTGQRLRKAQGSADTRYQYDGTSLLAESNAIGNLVSAYHYSATQLLSRTEAGSTPTYRHYLLDALKTPIALLTQDGAVSARTSYDAWGEIRRQQGTNGTVSTPSLDGAIANLIDTDAQPIGFTGYLKDDESGLYYAKARYYDPTVARFTSEDPEAGNPMQPPSLHRYMYAYGNPTVWGDPTGRIEELTAGAEQISSWNAWLRDLAGRQSNDTLGHVVSGGVGIGRGLLGLTEGALRAANVATNLYVVANAPRINDPRYHDSTVDNAERELQGTAHAAGQVMQFFDNGGAGKLYDSASRGLAQAHGGDNRSISDVVSVFSAVVAPTRVASMTAAEAANVAKQAVGAARELINIGEADAKVVVKETRGQAVSDRLERQMELIADSDFRLERTHEENIAAASNRVVSFGGPKTRLYNDRPDATLGGQGLPVWGMPLDDAARLRSRSDVVTQTGHAPGVTNAYLRGEPIYGVSVPTDQIDLRLPTALDGGSNHWRPGGHTGVEHDRQWRQNPTYEFVTNGGKPMPSGSVLFEFNSDGSWTPIRRF